ncbi:hypothetical protein RRG08_016088 [Elysia crispata]|uniref:Uncharacterized protein n=1 Tax=Elysia crispata TaxID=231223 RepID=A0AAE0ZQC2_9GAST|nr:hypothetical protein RRG08_016088 [Elysia crispata]
MLGRLWGCVDTDNKQTECSDTSTEITATHRTIGPKPVLTIPTAPASDTSAEITATHRTISPKPVLTIPTGKRHIYRDYSYSQNHMTKVRSDDTYRQVTYLQRLQLLTEP